MVYEFFSLAGKRINAMEQTSGKQNRSRIAMRRLSKLKIQTTKRKRRKRRKQSLAGA